MTNGEWLRQLSDEEIAKLINGQDNFCECCMENYRNCDDECETHILEWLKAENNKE